MRLTCKLIATAALTAGVVAVPAFGQALSPELKGKVEARLRVLQAWSADPAIVAAVKAHNANPPAEAQGMTNERWKSLTILDPLVRSFTRNQLGQYLKSKKDEQINECFVSGADGGKVAFLSKTSSWSHKDKPKHAVPMSGKTWTGPVEVDESTGQQQVQIGIPVLDGQKPIGSIVVGLAVTKLR
jgi:hypothetical protein